jgi:hypothetical protein
MKKAPQNKEVLNFRLYPRTEVRHIVNKFESNSQPKTLQK